MSTCEPKDWDIPVSYTAQNTFNPIRNVVETMHIEENPQLEVIRLTVGDPTVFGNLPPSEECFRALCDAIKSGKNNGYKPAYGCKEARNAVAKYSSTPEYIVDAEDFVLASGCSGAIEIAMNALVDRGDNILIPRPGFSLYKCICGSRGIEARSYKLFPENGWEVDLDDMASLIDERTKLIVVVNPSNPCGSVYKREHLEEILNIAEKYRVPVLCDEVYAHVTFGKEPFHSMGSLTKNVPVLVVGGIAKRFLVPGWRIGWIVIHDRNDSFGFKIRQALRRLCQVIVGPCSVIQAALPTILSDCPTQFFEKTLNLMKKTSNIFYESLSLLPELYPVRSQGAMYMLIGIKVDRLHSVKDDVDFTQKLMAEQSVFVLPATCFQCPNFFRVVLTCPVEVARVACERIAQFCRDHRKNALTNGHMEHENGIYHVNGY
ncbi:tyrosine aminotransferase-like isoform X4 [Xenia sp. Carnegie-2017]|nr:tyrosine aminotransferase-like isoform X4 [Xenia sp. Carnegie-2017]XP_046843429.1 tyrosine aminotransferase-like isoform X4 [Xenia sp. Carnegie-2017]